MKHPYVHLAVAALGSITGACGSGSASSNAAPTVALQPLVLTAQSSPSPSPTPTPTPVTPKSGNIGMNIATTAWWSGERPFLNLLVGSDWQDPGNKWTPVDEKLLDRSGMPLSFGTQGLAKMITPSPATWAGETAIIRCTWSGQGAVTIDGEKKDLSKGPGFWEFSRSSARLTPQNVWLTLSSSDTANPIRDLDCREKNEPREGVYAPEFIESIRPYSVIRFLDWSGSNANPTNVTWAGRTLPESVIQAGNQGVALEHMLNVVELSGASPWFNVPWNADEDYVRHMGQMVHDRIRDGRKVYFELSNEVWNSQFPATAQACAEGNAEGLSDDKFQSCLFRYSEKAAWMHKILTEIFADRPGQLVRVVATQNANPWTAEQVLSFRDNWKQFDALATAPYFGHSFFVGFDSHDIDAMMDRLAQMASESIPIAKRNADTAKNRGLRYITYEAGQHVLDGDDPIRIGQINRDPRIYDIYRKFIADYRAQIGTDLLTFFSSTSTISKYGAWGVREYAGQPLSETPKRRAILDSLAAP